MTAAVPLLDYILTLPFTFSNAEGHVVGVLKSYSSSGGLYALEPLAGLHSSQLSSEPRLQTYNTHTHHLSSLSSLNSLSNLGPSLHSPAFYSPAFF